jgi:tetratricopeptide (TPR) repeat protein
LPREELRGAAIATQLVGKLDQCGTTTLCAFQSEYFDEAMDRLQKKYLNVLLDAVLHPASLVTRQAAIVQQTVASTAPTVAKKELTAQEYFERTFDTKDVDEKLRFYTEARLKPDDVQAFLNPGIARANKGDLEGALHDYTAAIRVKPDYADAFNIRAIVRRAKGDLDGALQDYREAIRLKPDLAIAFYNRGIAQADKGDLEGALQDLTEAIWLKSDNAYAFYNRGIARQIKGDLDGAVRDYRAAIRVKPGYADAFNEGDRI